ncbi:hypothetical protein CALVIDRAFT_537490 [Calocera viscosa TUFC12733]|uniref:Uncharacterized protein n=1 Tax=Calocera viscosa (strain TUFC12733) TaxID=1330018 RepID=A0A167M492_CALVF|nr:hypothetical protein CALVIDRAFT_537490 [Calocera viscosa TUFC12733]
MSPSTPARQLTRDEITDAARQKLMTWKMKTTVPPGVSPPPISRPSSGITTPRNSRHSRGPSLSSPATNVQRHSPPLTSSTPPSRPPSSQTSTSTSSRSQSHHRRNSSLSTRRESREIMGVALSLPSSPQTNNEQPNGREDALQALEGRRPLSFVKGFEQVVVPDWKTPTVETSFEWPAPPKAALASAAFGSASLAGKRDSFGKNLVAVASLKDQLQTLLEEEEEEDEEAGLPRKMRLTPRASAVPTSSPVRQRPTNLRLEPAAPILPKKVAADQAVTARLRPLSLAASLPSPALTPSPRLTSLGGEPSSPPLGAGAFTTSPIKSIAPATPSTPSGPVLRPLSLASATLNPSPPTPSISPSGQSSILSPRSGPVSSSGSTDSVKQMRRMSTLSYRSSQSSSGGGRASPAFSLASSAAIEPSAPKATSPASSNQDRALHLQITYLQQENASLLARIAGLEKSLGQKEKQEDVSHQLRSRVVDLEQQVDGLKVRVDMERKDAVAAKEVARRLSERLWELERMRDAASINASNPTSPSLPHSKGTSASSPRSLFSGRPTSGASSFWGGSTGNHSMGSMTDVDEPSAPPAATGDLSVLPEEDENEDHEADRIEEEEEDTQEVDSAHQVGIEVTLMPESASSAGRASAASSDGSSGRHSMSAYSLSNASTSEAEAQSLAVLEGMASEGDAYLNGEPVEDWVGGLQEIEEEPEERAESDESFRSLPNPYDVHAMHEEEAYAPPSHTLAPFSMPATPVTPTTPTLRTPTVSSLQATYQQQPSKPSTPPRHAKTASQAAMMSWKFPNGAAKANRLADDDEKDRFFSTLEEEPPRKPGLRLIGKPMGRKEKRKKAVMRPYLGDDDFDDIQIANVPVGPHPSVPLHPAPAKGLSQARPAVAPAAVKGRAPSPTTAPAPTWSMRSPSPPRTRTSSDASSTRVHLQPRQASTPTPPPSGGSGFSFTKLTSVFSSWVAPAPAPTVPRITISTVPAPPSHPPLYFAPAEPAAASPARGTRTVLPARAVRKETQPKPVPSPLDKLDFRGGGCRHCEGELIEL